MKVLATLSIVCIAAIAYAKSAGLDITPEVSNVECPIHNGENATLIPNPNDCNTYYTCETGIPFLMKCPPGLHFNAREYVCDWPAQACCDKKYLQTKYCKKVSTIH